MTSDSLGEAIKKERESRRLTLRGFAETLGISAAYLVDIEKNRRMPNAELLQRIADHLDLPLASFDQFSPDVPKAVSTWLDKNPAFKRLLGFLRKSPEPDALLARVEKTFNQPRQRKCLIAIYASELQAIGLESRSWEIETGGDLFGIWGDIPVVFLATRAGPKAKRESTHFQLDVDYLIKLSATLERDWGLRYFGDWHSHHRLGLQHPSTGDQKRIVGLARKNHFDEMAEFIVTFPPESKQEKKIRVHPYAYLDLPSDTLSDVTLIVLKGISPVREALIAASALPEQQLDVYASFPIEGIAIPQEPLGRISGSEGPLVEQITERLIAKALAELTSHATSALELYRQPFGFIIVVPVGNHTNLALAFDKHWPHPLLQVDWMDRASGHSDEIAHKNIGASLVQLGRVKQVLSEITEAKREGKK